MLPKSPGFERIQGAMTDGRGPIRRTRPPWWSKPMPRFRRRLADWRSRWLRPALARPS